MLPSVERIALNVRAEVARKRRTQDDLAELLGITRQAVGRRLSGQTPIRADELAKIAAYLSVTVDDLLDTPKATAS